MVTLVAARPPQTVADALAFADRAVRFHVRRGMAGIRILPECDSAHSLMAGLHVNSSRIGARRTLFLSFAAATLALSGCSAGSDTDAEPTAEASEEPTVQSSAEPTDEPSEEPTAEPTAIDCLEGGTWYDDAAARYQALSVDLAAKGQVHTLTTSGDLTYAFDDGTMTVTYVNWKTDYSLLDNTRGEISLMHAENGPAIAPYTATETEITALEADVSTLAVEYVAAGQGFTVSNEEMVGLMKEFIAQPVSWSFTCTADELVLTPIVDEGVTPIPVVLHHR